MLYQENHRGTFGAGCETVRRGHGIGEDMAWHRSRHAKTSRTMIPCMHAFWWPFDFISQTCMDVFSWHAHGSHPPVPSADPKAQQSSYYCQPLSEANLPLQLRTKKSWLDSWNATWRATSLWLTLGESVGARTPGSTCIEVANMLEWFNMHASVIMVRKCTLMHEIVFPWHCEVVPEAVVHASWEKALNFLY